MSVWMRRGRTSFSVVVSVLGLVMAVACDYRHPDDECDESTIGQSAVCDGNTLVRCQVRDSVCKDCHRPTYIQQTPCPADRPICQSVPPDISATRAICQVRDLIRWCPLEPIGLPMPASGTVVVADVNGDARSDLVLRDRDSYTVALGTINDGYRKLAPQPAPDGFGDRMYAGDFNGDGRKDLLFGAYVDGASDVVRIAHGRGDGSFDAPKIVPLPGIDFYVLHGLLVTDINRDGKDDFVGVEGTSGKIVVVLGAAGVPKPLAPQGVVGCDTHATSSDERCIVADHGDFNADGYADLLLAVGTRYTVALGSASGKLTARPFEESRASRWRQVRAGDVNHDGKLDLVATEETTVGIHLGKGDGTFHPRVPAPPSHYQHIRSCYAGSSSCGFLLSDIDGDGRSDIVFHDEFARVIVTYTGAPNGGLGTPVVHQPSVDDRMRLLDALAPVGSGGRDLLFVNDNQLAVFHPSCR